MLISLKRALTTVCIAGSVCAVVAPLSAQATLACLSLSGKVRLDPDTSCKITTAYPDQAYIPNACFSVQMTIMNIVARGSAGLTMETMVMANGGQGSTPAMLNENGVPAVQNEFGFPETRRLITGRSAVSLPGGTVFTADAGVVHGEYATEQIIITGGNGLYANASGILFTSGKYIGQWGNYSGQLCYSR